MDHFGMIRHNHLEDIIRYAVVSMLFLNVGFMVIHVLSPSGRAKSAQEVLSFMNTSSKQEEDFSLIPPGLDAAIEYLNLPSWSRGYVRCTEKESEVSCNDIIRAEIAIKEWEKHIKEVPEDQRKYFVLEHPVKGLGNKMSTDVVAMILAMMSNRTLLVLSNYPSDKGLQIGHSYLFPDTILTNTSTVPDLNLSNYKKLPTDRKWNCADVLTTIKSDQKYVGINDLIYSTMVYTNEQTARFAKEKFGFHAIYFISNWLSRFPPDVVEAAKKLLSTVPPNSPVLGAHVRYHRAGQYYSHGLNYTLPIVYEEFDHFLSTTKGYIAFATDNKELNQIIKDKYGAQLINSDALRRPDSDHQSAMIDMVLLLGCDRLLATYRSTFSFAIVSRHGQAARWLEKESPHAIPLSNSQAAGVSMIYHHRDKCDWRTNDRVTYCGTSHRETLNDFFNYMIL